MPTYRTSTGKRYTTQQIDDKIRVAKAEVLKNQFEEYGYNFCEQCGNNGSGTRLDCAHDLSVKRCKEEGRSEVAWDIRNINVLCRTCHQEKDGLNIQSTRP